MTPAILCIGGMDSSGGAGLSRDSATIEALGGRMRAAVTAVTAQDDGGVRANLPLPRETVLAQIASAGPVQAVKIGMLGTAPITRAVAQALPEGFRVLDPVLASSSGFALLEPEGMGCLLSDLLPRVDLVTPNLPELYALARHLGCSSDDAAAAARVLLGAGAGAVLVKGGHSEGAESVDTLYRPDSEERHFPAPRVEAALRGTGCRLASAIACGMARGDALECAVAAAKAHVHAALRAARGGMSRRNRGRDAAFQRTSFEGVVCDPSQCKYFGSIPKGPDMPRRFIDLSVALEADIPSDPEIMLPEIEYLTHAQTAGQMTGFFEGLDAADLPGGEGWAVERLNIATHNGTHLDAPYHHHSTMNNGERAITIDEVPLEWCFAPGVKLDFRHVDDGTIVTPGDVEAELKRIGHDLRPLDIVVVNTSAGARYGEADYLSRGCGMGRDATMYLLERGVRLTGTDAWSWDAPFSLTAQRYTREKDPSIIWEGHRASMEIGYCHLEKLANLDQLPGSGFLISCFPFKIKAASAGFTRAVAIFED